MSAAETANLVTPSSGLGLPGTITALDSPVDVITSSREPLTGPDGRVIGEEQRTPRPVTVGALGAAGTPGPTPGRRRESPAVKETDIGSEVMSKVETKETKGTARVTEIKPTTPSEKTVVIQEAEAPDHVIDIVKQSKLEMPSSAAKEGTELPEFPASRPITEASMRESSKMTYDSERRDKADSYAFDRDSQTPLSVRVERKPLHTAQTRSHSDYFSKTPSTSRYTYIAASLGNFSGLPPDFKAKELPFRPPNQQQRARRPPKLIRLATVSMEPKTKPVPRGPSLYYEEPKKPAKVVTWDEATDTRPPLRIDMEGPGPTHYSPRNKPLHETNSPAWSFGGRTFNEKEGGSRTSWEKTWFQSTNVWTNKVDFYNDSAWPAPTHYKQRPLLGPRQRTTIEAPSFTIGVRKEFAMSKHGSDKEPSPVDYDKDLADKVTMNTGPSFSHQFRRQGTIMWGAKDRTPGPGAYNPNFGYNKPHQPNYTIRHMRREKSHILGPFSTF